jgi:hypothetical protein
MKTKVMLLLLVTFGAACVSAHAQAADTAKDYNTREPFACKSKKDPAKGAPSSGQANDYVRCTNEKISGGYISLLQNVQVEVGKSRPYSAWSDVGNSDIDNSQPVYPIRGSYDLYSCRPPGSMGFPAGANCNVFKANTFAGICYKTTFSDWSCPVQGTSAPFTGEQDQVAPPK